MDLTDSENSEAGESGWTMYLEHSCNSKYRSRRYSESTKHLAEEEEEEEDLSMVSDASSGPRYRYGEEEEEEEVYSTSSREKKKKMKESYGRFYQPHSSCLDDTASSKNLCLGQNEAPVQQFMDLSQSFPATKFKGKLGKQKSLGLIESTRSGKQSTEERGGKQRKKNG